VEDTRSGDEHGRCVDAWMERHAAGLTPEPLVRAFEQAFGVLYRRAHRTIGTVTLAAILERVLNNASERCPALAALRVDAAGLDWEGLRKSAAHAGPVELQAGLRFVLVEFLTVLGNLTGEILTPALHSELSNMADIEDAQS